MVTCTNSMSCASQVYGADEAFVTGTFAGEALLSFPSILADSATGSDSAAGQEDTSVPTCSRSSHFGSHHPCFCFWQPPLVI
jgi:hypothetical protein